MTITRVLAVFLYGTFACIIVTIVTSSTKFIEFEKVEGFTCPSDQVIFDDVNKGSLIQCVFHCSKTSSCYGVLRVRESMRCIGCKDKYLTNVTVPLLNGTEYYRRQGSNSLYVESYKLVQHKMNWNDAEKNCEDLGGHLLYIKTEEEQRFLEQHVIPDWRESDRAFGSWIGAKRSGNSSFFFWQDGTNVSDGYSKWDKDMETTTIAQCMLIYMNAKRMELHWYRYPCNFQYDSICEFD